MKKYIWPVTKHFFNEVYVYNGLIKFGIAGWAVLGVVFLVEAREWLGCLVIALIVAVAVLDTIISLRNTLKRKKETGD